MHRNQQKHFPRRKIIWSKPGVIICCDLADVSSLSRYNNGVKFLMICVNVYSRYMKVGAVKKKDGQTILSDLKSILEDKDEKFNNVKRLFCDKGEDSYNRYVMNYLSKRKAKIYCVHSYEIKSSICERSIRTSKSKMYSF